MTAALNPGIGVSTSPSLEDLKAFALQVFQNIGASFGPNKAYKLAAQFARRMPNGNGYAFFLFLTNAVQMSEAQKRRALADPNIARAISYADPTGEKAVENVMRGRPQ